MWSWSLQLGTAMRCLLVLSGSFIGQLTQNNQLKYSLLSRDRIGRASRKSWNVRFCNLYFGRFLNQSHKSSCSLTPYQIGIVCRFSLLVICIKIISICEDTDIQSLISCWILLPLSSIVTNDLAIVHFYNAFECESMVSWQARKRYQFEVGLWFQWTVSNHFPTFLSIRQYNLTVSRDFALLKVRAKLFWRLSAK